MSSSYQPITIPLLEGMRQDVANMDGRKPRIHVAQNIDYSIDGHLQGRLGWTLRSSVMQRRTLHTTNGPSTDSVALGALPFDFQSMFRYKDTGGERPGVYAVGRVWTEEDGHWADRLYCGAAKVDRLNEFFYSSSLPAATDQNATADNFHTDDLPSTGAALLGGAHSTVDTYVAGPGEDLFGGACNVISGSDVYHCSVGNNSTNNVLRLVVRKNNDLVLSTFTINVAANDCQAASATIRSMDPRCASDPTSSAAGGTACLWVAYKENGANNLKFARVNPINGAILASVNYAIAATTVGFWLSSDSADNRIYTCISRTGTNDLVCEAHNATTLANLALAATYAAGFVVEGPCVIGGGIVATRKPYFALTTQPVGAVLDGETSVVVGIYDTSVPSAVALKTFFGSVAISGHPSQTWSIMHQPVLLGTSGQNQRTILGLIWAPGRKPGVAADPREPATWFAVDLSNLIVGTSGVFSTLNPGILAKGPSKTSAIPFGPVHAVPGKPDSSSYVNSYRFPNLNHTSFSAAGARGTTWGLNQVTLTQPKAATIGEQTVLAGSVPHMIARGYCCEVGFPMTAPEIILAAAGGGVLPNGSYTVQACWKWIDEAGVTHRSAFSKASTITLGGANTAINVISTNCQLTERQFKATPGTLTPPIQIETYCTTVNPVATSLKFLQTTTAEATAAAVTTSVIVGSAGLPLLNTEPQYTSGGVFQNNHVSADAGVAVVGRRMWMSNGRVVFASKLYTPGKVAPAWNDEGILQVNIPAPAGKVVSLENFGDKLVILCERGILVTYGDGPDDTGVGPSFVFPITVSPLGISSELASVSTPKGVAFHANNTIDNASGVGQLAGGVYLMTGGSVEPIGLAVNKHLKAGPAQLAFLPERDLLLINNYNTTGLIDAVPNVLALNLRNGNWAVWTNPNGDLGVGNPGVCFGLTEAAGVMWGGYLFGSGGGMEICSLDRTDGKDNSSGASDQNIKMAIQTNNIYADTQNALGWTRVRSVNVMGDFSNAASVAHTLTIRVFADRFGTEMNKSFTYTAVSTGTNWPTDHLSPEFRLPRQKMSQIVVQVEAAPAITQWSALRFDVLPLNTLAPAKNRG